MFKEMNLGCRRYSGVVVDEVRMTNLSYAPEIAQVMLRRQLAEAVIAARQKIVHDAVSMVDLALKELAAKQAVVKRRGWAATVKLPRKKRMCLKTEF